MPPEETAMPQNQQFEIPQELRQLAEENVERARKLYLQFMEGVSRAMGTWSTPSAETTPGFNEVRQRAIKFAQENADAAFNLATEIAKAKNLQELVTLQTRYAQSQMTWYAQQTQAFGQLMAKAFAGTQSPPQPNEPPAPGMPGHGQE
jgi:phasin